MAPLRLAFGATVVALMTMLAGSPTQAYPVFTCTITDVDVEGGEDATVTASLDPETEADFELNYDGQVHTEDGVTSTTATFQTDEVDEETETTVTGTATIEGGDEVPCSGTITLEPEDDDGDGDGDGDGDADGDGDGDGDNGGLLPNTGGERLVWLIIGLILVVVGSAAYLASRRKDA